MASIQPPITADDFLAASGRRHEFTQTQSQIQSPNKSALQEGAVLLAVPRFSRPHLELNAPPQLVLESGTSLIQDSNVTATADAHSRSTAENASDAIPSSGSESGLFAEAFPGERRPSFAGENLHRPSAALVELNRAEQQRLAQLYAAALAPFGMKHENESLEKDSIGGDSAAQTRKPQTGSSLRQSLNRSEISTLSPAVAAARQSFVLPPIGVRHEQRPTRMGMNESPLKNGKLAFKDIGQQSQHTFLTSLVTDALKSLSTQKRDDAPENTVRRLKRTTQNKIKPKSNTLSKFLPSFYTEDAGNGLNRLTVSYSGPEVSSSSTASTTTMTNGRGRVANGRKQARMSLEVTSRDTVASLKRAVAKAFRLQANARPCVDEESPSHRVLQLAFAGAVLDDSWRLADLHIGFGATINAYIEEERDPVLHILVAYCEETIHINESFRVRTMRVSQLKSMVSRRSGLPVSAFRLVSPRGVEMYDSHLLDDYEVGVGDTIRADTWDGLNDFLALCQMGFSKNAIEELERENDQAIVRYLLRVAQYMAAHFGHVELATVTLKLGARPGEGVGEHPLRAWVPQSSRHPDTERAPIHEAAEFGQAAVLRAFLHYDTFCVLSDGWQGVRPLILALRSRQRSVASILIAKQWQRVSLESTTVSLRFMARLKKWANGARERAYYKFGEERSTFRPKRATGLQGACQVGSQRLFLSENQQQNAVLADYFHKLGRVHEGKLSTAAGNNVPAPLPPIVRRAPDGRIELIPRQRAPQLPSKKVSVASNVSGPGLEALMSGSATGTGSNPRAGHRKSSSPMNPSATASGKAALSTPSQTALAVSAEEFLKAVSTVQEEEDLERLERKSSAADSTVTTAIARAYGRKRSRSRSPNKSNSPDRSHSRSRDPSHPTSGLTVSKSNRVGTGIGIGIGTVTGAVTRSITPVTPTPKPASSIPTPTRLVPKLLHPQQPKIRSGILLARRKKQTADGELTLPLKSHEDVPRPMFYQAGINTSIEHPIRDCLAAFESRAGTSKRDMSVRALSIASRFKRKSWLQRVHAAVYFARREVPKMLAASKCDKDKESNHEERGNGQRVTSATAVLPRHHSNQ